MSTAVKSAKLKVARARVCFAACYDVIILEPLVSLAELASLTFCSPQWPPRCFFVPLSFTQGSALLAPQ